MFETAVSQARNDEIERVEAVIRPALTAAAADVLQADGYLLGTPERSGHRSVSGCECPGILRQDCPGFSALATYLVRRLRLRAFVVFRSARSAR
jgi:hypothetical protein